MSFRSRIRSYLRERVHRNMRRIFIGRGLKAAVMYYVLFETDNHHLLYPRPRNGSNYKLKVKGKTITLELHVKYTRKGKPFLADYNSGSLVKATNAERRNSRGEGVKTLLGRPQKTTYD